MIHIPHIETDISTACDLSCTCCNHLIVPYRAQKRIWSSVPAQVEKDLFHLTTILHADRWGALGGEPTLSKDLVPILKIVRQSSICDQIEVWTNGIQLSKGRMPDEFWKSFDILVLSVYEGKHTEQSLEWIRLKCQDSGVELVIKDERTWKNFKTNLEPVPTNPVDTKLKFDGCFFKSFSRVVNNGYFFVCCCAPHMPRLLQGRPEGSDGIPIEGLTESALQAYLTRTEPLGCCTICAGRDTAKPIQWSEERNPEKWLMKSKGL